MFVSSSSLNFFFLWIFYFYFGNSIAALPAFAVLKKKSRSPQDKHQLLRVLQLCIPLQEKCCNRCAQFVSVAFFKVQASLCFKNQSTFSGQAQFLLPPLTFFTWVICFTAVWLITGLVHIHSEICWLHSWWWLCLKGERVIMFVFVQHRGCLCDQQQHCSAQSVVLNARSLLSGDIRIIICMLYWTENKLFIEHPVPEIKFFFV